MVNIVLITLDGVRRKDILEGPDNNIKEITKMLFCEIVDEENRLTQCHNVSTANSIQVVTESSSLRVVARPMGLWSHQANVKNEGNEECLCHTYPQKEAPTGEVDDECYYPISPKYYDGAEIECMKIPPKCISTNSKIIDLAERSGVSKYDIAKIPGTNIQGLFASFEDVNVDARTRGGGGGGMPKDYEPQCITICDCDGVEREGLILFKEEDHCCIESGGGST